MPLITKPIWTAAALALVVSLSHADSARAQPPARVDYGASRPHTSAPQIPWTDSQPPGAQEPRRLMPTAYQAPLAEPAHQPQATRQPQPLPLARKPDAAAGPLGGGQHLKPFATGAASLGLVLGLFLLVMWSVRRGMPKGAGLLPTEAVEVLGRAPLGNRQHVHLVRCGNKLVLLSVTAAGVEALTEISDPAEVEHLQEVCRQSSSVSAGGLKQLVGRLGNVAQMSTRNEPPERLDFGHLEAGGYRRA